ncbi:oocyte zinc finger protein XlCOF6-like [Corythoichthys intestinalis]|uniref:oocyte zinc finger protein XlCOF6-like n=1 Tax=Corythoichthys intestinalis TaxID=161448 RepID=UPI0025A50237|nr:oocyte zinc finger protein XlCOF6-like [Corythoichthys intestinalis]
MYDPTQVLQEEMLYIKKESEPEIPNIKEEEQEDEITKFPMTVSVKIEEDEGPNEAAEPSGDSSFHHLKPKGEGRSQPDGLLAPLSDSDDVTSHSSDTDTNEEDVDFDPKCSKSSNKSSLERGAKECTGGKSFGCSHCDTSFSQKRLLAKHDKCTADVTIEELHPQKHDLLHVKQEVSEMPYIKQEAEPQTPSIKEEQEEEIPKFPMTVRVKIEEECQSDSSFQHLTTKGEGQSQPDGLLAPLSDSDDITSHSSDFDTDEKDKDFDQNALKSLKKSSLKRRTKVVGKPFTCSLCDKTYSLKHHLKRHMLTHTGEKPFACSFCDKRFIAKKELNDHTRTHTGEKPFPCSVCQKRFSTKGLLARHVITHTGERHFACSVCDKRYFRKSHLITHTMTHTGEKPFQCASCGRAFTFKGCLKRHTRKHTGEKPFVCTACGKRYTEKRLLDRHTLTHTGEKPFVCTSCGKRFLEKADFINHTRTHTGEKPFACSCCDKRFCTKQELRSHTRTHTGAKPFACSRCYKRFSTKRGLKRHTPTHTG